MTESPPTPIVLLGRTVDELLAIAAVLVAALPLRAVYADPTFGWTLFVVPAGVFVTTLVAARWLPALPAFLVGLCASVPLITFTTRVGVTELPDAVRETVPRLLTVVLPWHSDSEVAAGLAFVVGAAAATTAMLAIGPRRRTMVMAPPVVLFGLSVALASSTSSRFIGAAVALAAIAALFLAVGRPLLLTDAAARRNRSSMPQSAGSSPAARTGSARVFAVLSGAALLAGVALLAQPVGQAVAGEDRTELRRDTDADPNAMLTPLAVYRKLQAQQPDDAVMSVTLPPGVERIRLAVLDEYDGVSWGSRTDFVDTGGRLGAVSGSELAQVETFDLPGQFVPVPPSAAEIESISVRFSPENDVVLTADGQVVGSRRYTVTYDPSTAQGNDLVLSKLGDISTGPAADALASIDLSDDGFNELATEVTSSAIGPYNKLRAIKQYMDEELEVGIGDEPAVQGTSFAVLYQLLSAEGAKAVSTEQYVTLFAWFADAADIPVRLAVGFALPQAPTAVTPDAPPTATRLSGADAHVWPEVHFEELGWEPFEVTEDVPPTEAQQQAEKLLEPAADDESALNESSLSEDTEPDSEPAPDEDGTGRGFPALQVFGVLILAAAIASVPTWKARRRRRRRALPPSDSTEAAWAELVQRLADIDVDLNPSATADDPHTQVQSRAPDAVPSMSIVALAVQEVVYGETDPPQEVVDATWHAVDATLLEVRGAAPFPKRLLAPFRWRGLKNRSDQ